MDLDTLTRLNQRFAPTVLVSTGNKTLLRSIGFEDVHELDWWDDTQINPTLKITFAPTQHFSGRSLWDRQKSLWGSYMLHYRNRLIYFGGDSGYSTPLLGNQTKARITRLGISGNWSLRTALVHEAHAHEP